MRSCLFRYGFYQQGDLCDYNHVRTNHIAGLFATTGGNFHTKCPTTTNTIPPKSPKSFRFSLNSEIIRLLLELIYKALITQLNLTGRRFPLACLLFYCLFQACSQKVCPAFESFYLLDENTREKQFSYFVDSLPRTDIAKVHKNRYGIGDEPFLASLVNKIPPPIHSPWAKINTIEPVVIYPELPDSLEFAGDELMAAEMDIPDSSAFEADTTEVAKNWHFNIDQENYFNYLIKRLNIPIVPVEDAESAVEEQETTATETDSTGAPQKKGFLRNLFKKKNKEETQELVPSDSTQNQNGNNR